jgi:hypothetical protein
MTAAGVRATALAIGVALSAGTLAQGMSKDQHQAGITGLAAELKSERAACASLAGNARDICKAEAGGRASIGRAELNASYKPSLDASYNLRIARADAALAVDREKCDDSAGNVKDVCLKEAKARSVSAKGDASAQLKIARANAVAREKGADAHQDAAKARREAEGAVAREKCDAFAGEAKANCLQDARLRYGKS